MKSFTSAVLLLAGLATASPVQTRQEQGPYEVSSFSASKIHNSGTCK